MEPARPSDDAAAAAASATSSRGHRFGTPRSQENVSSGPFQYTVAEALALPEHYFTAFRENMRAKRDLLTTGLKDAGFEVFRTAGPTDPAYAVLAQVLTPWLR